ncbi:MAG: oligosaccharide flippase family protein [Peptococcales bacterium]|jgi:O-antigen/teichoic acid export membrane protein
MNNQERVVGNAVSSILQVLITGITLFFLYRYLLVTIGVENLGIWSLVLATTSISQVSNLGLVDCVVKFVAKYVALEDQESIEKIIQTILITVGLTLGVMLLILNFFSRELLAFFIQVALLPDALGIFPIALISAWVMAMAWIIMGALDGYHRIDLRNYTVIGNNLTYIFLSILLVNKYGLMGLAIAQLLGSIFLLVVSSLFLKKYVRLPLIPKVWDKKLFKEMLGYGLNFQVIVITKLLYDPITKGLMALFGGLAMVGYYEMASKMIQQFRGLIVSANQVLIPTIADLNEREPHKIKRIYLESYQLVFFVSIPLFSLIAILIPIIAELWIGQQEIIFITISLILLVGWFLNILSAPAYFTYLGIGCLKWNVISQLVIAGLNLILSWILGFYYGGLGVVLGFTSALILGSSIVMLAYHIAENVSWKVLLTFNNSILLIAGLINITTYYFFYGKYLDNLLLYLRIPVLLTLFCLLTIVPISKHPLRIKLQYWSFQLYIKKRIFFLTPRGSVLNINYQLEKRINVLR